jgi:hypothetical protein
VARTRGTSAPTLQRPPGIDFLDVIRHQFEEYLDPDFGPDSVISIFDPLGPGEHRSVLGYYGVEMFLKLKDIRAASRGDTAGVEVHAEPENHEAACGEE